MNMNLQNRTILVTGSAGFIGSNLVLELSSPGTGLEWDTTSLSEGILRVQIATGVSDVQADVERTEGIAKTWTSLANAINELGWTDISLDRPVIIDEDLTIPAGTTVTTNIAPVMYTDGETEYSILVLGATLTVDGTLTMQTAAEGALAMLDAEDRDAAIDVNGTVSRTVLTSIVPAADADLQAFKLTGIGGVYFTVSSGAYSTFYITNMANAGTIVSATKDLSSDVETYGTVGAQDASFAVAEDASEYAIIVTVGSNVSMGTLSIGAGVAFTVNTGDNTMFTGTVSAPVADGESNTSVSMARASGITLVAYSDMGIETTYGMAAYGTVDGTVAVTEGTLDIGRGNTNTSLTVADKASFTVESGATLDIAAGRTLSIADADGVVIEGTFDVANANGIAKAAGTTGYIVLTVAGTMNVDVNSFGTDVVLVITGALNVAEDYEMDVKAPVIIGAAPTTLGVGGSMSGSYDINNTENAFILAYAGADLTGAQFNWNDALNESNAQSTVYNVNDTAYATVYANGGVQIGEIFGVNPENSKNYVAIELVGYDTEDGYVAASQSANYGLYTWYDANGAKATGDIGDYENVYIEFDVAGVVGIISKDAGIILTIDSLVVNDYVGGDVSQTIQYVLGVGTHTIAWSDRSGYSTENATVTFNGTPVQNGGTITITADMTEFTIIADGAVPSDPSGGDSGTGGDDGMGLTDYLLIILVVLIVVMAIMVALRLMRS